MRLGQHISSNKVFDSWSIIEDLGSFINESDLNIKELQYIYTFKPKYNSQSKSLNFNKNKKNFLIKNTKFIFKLKNIFFFFFQVLINFYLFK
jgi:hypothetical protein